MTGPFSSNRLKCEYCGSTWFREVYFARYSAVTIDVPVKSWCIPVCLCGRAALGRPAAARSGRRLATEADLFGDSAGKAAAVHDIQPLIEQLESKAPKDLADQARKLAAAVRQRLEDRLRKLRRRRKFPELLPLSTRTSPRLQKSPIHRLASRWLWQFRPVGQDQSLPASEAVEKMAFADRIGLF